MTKTTRPRPERGDPTAIAAPLARWYAGARRDLPWRRNPDPYPVWLSEIMCQQTRVSVVIPYFERFLSEFPRVEDLAAAPVERVLELWAGLGYYSRGRNLKRAAQTVVEEHGGEFPNTITGLRSLPGVGEYTAAAIGSIAFDLPEPVIDGNVERVLARHGAVAGDVKKGEPRKEIRERARHALDEENPGDHNQAMMELGATVCTPKNPTCDACPIAESCAAFAEGTPEAYPPVRAKRAPETQHWVALAIEWEGEVWTVARDGDEELLPGHRGLPLGKVAAKDDAPTEKSLLKAARELLAAAGSSDSTAVRETRGDAELELRAPVRHSITYRRLHVHPVVVRGLDPRAVSGDFEAKDPGQLPALFRKIIHALRAPQLKSPKRPAID